MQGVTGPVRILGNRFACEAGRPFRLKILLEGVAARYTTDPTIISIKTDHPFSFLLRDVDSGFPIWIPEYGVAVTDADDIRSVAEIAETITGRGGRSRLQQFEAEPEETFEAAAEHVRRMSCHTWLGVSRNMRIFAIGEKLDWIEPRFYYFQALLPENATNACCQNPADTAKRFLGVAADQVKSAAEFTVLAAFNYRTEIRVRVKTFVALRKRSWFCIFPSPDRTNRHPPQIATLPLNRYAMNCPRTLSLDQS
jgi:hypothetical protein